MVHFERRKGKWRVKIPNAYGEGEHFIAPVRADLELQFQPVGFKKIDDGSTFIGVGCVPGLLIKKRGDNDAVPEPTKENK